MVCSSQRDGKRLNKLCYGGGLGFGIGLFRLRKIPLFESETGPILTEKSKVDHSEEDAIRLECWIGHGKWIQVPGRIAQAAPRN